MPASAEELADFETDVLAGFVLARASAGLADSTIRNDTSKYTLIACDLLADQPAEAAGEQHYAPANPREVLELSGVEAGSSQDRKSVV